MFKPKPRLVRDISPSWRRGRFWVGRTVFSALPSRVNLAYRREVRIAASTILKLGVVAAAAWFLISGSVMAPTLTSTLAAPVSGEEERKALEGELKELERQIEEYENQILSYQKQGNTLKNEIASLNSKIAKLNLQIRAINLTLRELDTKIAETAQEIAATEQNMEDKKDILARLIRELDDRDRSGWIEVFLKNPRISDFFSDINNLSLLQNNLRLTILEISDLRDSLVDQKEQYALARADAASLRSYQEAQRAEADRIKLEKNRLLEVTKGQESRYQKILQEARENAAQIRSRIFQLLGGGEMRFEDAYKLAKLAESATGIRAAFLLAVLDRESALGQNVGRCKYNEINSRSGKPTMHPTRDVPLFLEITAALNIDPESVTVSCANADGAYGGAMGPAQFIPSTWKLYAPQVAAITGHPVPSPWNNADAFVATALYIRDALQSCAAVYSNSLSQERCAAAKYYAGSRWRSYLWTYGEAVVGRAQQFERDIVAITS